MHFKWSKCPHCGKTLECGIYAGGIWESKLGKPDAFNCPYCRGWISNGMMEWGEMDWVDKALEIGLFTFTMLVIAPGFGALLGILIGLVLEKFLGVGSSVNTPLAIGGAGITTITYVYNMTKELIHSKRRMAAK